MEKGINGFYLTAVGTSENSALGVGGTGTVRREARLSQGLGCFWGSWFAVAGGWAGMGGARNFGEGSL